MGKLPFRQSDAGAPNADQPQIDLFALRFNADAYQHAVAKYVLREGKPWTTFESSSLLDLLKLLNPKATSLSDTTVRAACNKVYVEALQQLSEILQKVRRPSPALPIFVLPADVPVSASDSLRTVRCTSQTTGGLRVSARLPSSG